jgi:hypothetical protein
VSNPSASIQSATTLAFGRFMSRAKERTENVYTQTPFDEKVKVMRKLEKRLLQ